MNWRRPRTRLALATFFVAIIGGALFWSGDTGSSSVRLRFLYSTNHPTIGAVGVFKLVNFLEESISVGSGFYKNSSRGGVTPREGDFEARPLTAGRGAAFVAQSTNVFEMWVPTTGGPYRAVLRCAPASKMTPTFLTSRRLQLAGAFWRWWASVGGGPTVWGQDIVYGTIIAESQPFEIGR